MIATSTINFSFPNNMEKEKISITSCFLFRNVVIYDILDPNSSYNALQRGLQETEASKLLDVM